MQIQVQTRGAESTLAEQWASQAIGHALDRLGDRSMHVRVSVQPTGDRVQCRMHLERAGAQRLTVCHEADTVTEAISKSAHVLERRLRRRIGRRRTRRIRPN